MSHSVAHKRLSRLSRHRRIRATVHGTAARPRLVIFRSLKHISAQLVDDAKGTTVLSASDRELTNAKGTKTERAMAVGKALGEKAQAKKITSVVFDRGGNLFHGRVKALAEGARQAGLTF